MKTINILTIVIIASCSNFIYSQNDMSDGKVEYEMNLNLDEYITYKSELIFNNKLSKFTYTNLQVDSEKTDNDGNIRITVSDTVPHIIYNDLKNSKLMQYDCLISPKEHVWIEESTQKIDWELLDETKKIGNFTCNNAIGVFRGRKYLAWYTTEISNSFGPWKLQGLPGIILEAYDDTKEVVFMLKKITIPYKESMILSLKPTEIIPFDKVKQIKNDKISELIKKLESKQDRDFTVKITVNNKNQIEKE